FKWSIFAHFGLFGVNNPRGFSDRDRRPGQGGGYTTAALIRAGYTTERRRLQNRLPAQGGGFAQNAKELILETAL
ncbi:hypothetical protein KI387_043587, partial [Taxus chinensis]